jgi:hypothetical protein
VAQLCQHQEEFKKRDTCVIIISFGTLPAVQEWMRENCDHFTVLLDRERKVYKAYGLEASFWRAYHPRTLWLYAKAIIAGKKMHNSHGDDTTQLGGDFIISTDGKFKLVYPSYDPTDRPPLEKLLKVLDQH